MEINKLCVLWNLDSRSKTVIQAKQCLTKEFIFFSAEAKSELTDPPFFIKMSF